MIRTFSNILGVIFMFVITLLSGCGKSSSSIPTTVPNSATVFYAHNLVFSNGTTLMSTGYNGFGQLGSGNLGNRTALGLLSAHYPFRGFATGGNHSVAFFNNSTVRTWGYNGFGQLGNNSTTYSSNPVPVFRVISSASVNLSGIKAVAAGAYHTLALDNKDTLWSWGQNYYGQLGVDFPSTPFLTSHVPVKVNGGGIVFSNISAIAANGYHSLARANGFVWAWGFNGTGQLGIDPKTTGAISSPNRVAIPTAGIIDIAAGGAFNYAVAKDNTVWAWGNNDYGQLGNGTLTQNYIPAQVKKSDGTNLTGVVQVAAGIQHGLARLSDGTVWAWGYNFFGQLGNGSTKDSTVAVQVAIPAGMIVTDIRAFGSSSMAKVGSGWYVWGDNFYGQLGLASTGKVLSPEKMPGL
jgi:alpha-tubulin suppressor-like RCC1 family protein